MKSLIVTADDFGYTKSVNKGIIEAYLKGIVTSTSLMVYGNAASEAANLNQYSKLSVGLHFQITDEGLIERLKKSLKFHLVSTEEIQNEIERQVNLFKQITGRMPTHIDGHHHMHKLPRVAPIMKAYAKANNIPVRNFDGINFIDTFFGWNKLQQASPHQISEAVLIKILENLPDGTSELMCHPGYVDDELINTTRYSRERAIELTTLTSDKVKAAVNKLGVMLISRNG